MHGESHPWGTNTTCAACWDAAYEPGWYAVLRMRSILAELYDVEPRISLVDEATDGRAIVISLADADVDREDARPAWLVPASHGFTW